MITLAERITELQNLANQRGVDVDHQFGDLYDPDLAVLAYAELLNLDAALAFDLDLSLSEIVEFSKLLT